MVGRCGWGLESGEPLPSVVRTLGDPGLCPAVPGSPEAAMETGRSVRALCRDPGPGLGSSSVAPARVELGG